MVMEKMAQSIVAINETVNKKSARNRKKKKTDWTTKLNQHMKLPSFNDICKKAHLPAFTKKIIPYQLPNAEAYKKQIEQQNEQKGQEEPTRKQTKERNEMPMPLTKEEIFRNLSNNNCLRYVFPLPALQTSPGT